MHSAAVWGVRALVYIGTGLRLAAASRCNNRRAIALASHSPDYLRAKQESLDR